MKTKLFAAVLALSSLSAVAAPLELKGLTLGMPADEAASVHKVACEKQICVSMTPPTVAGVTPRMFFYGLRDNAIAYVRVEFDQDNFNTMAAVEEKYGKPVIDEVGDIQNAMGASFKSRVVVWGDPKAGEYLRLVERAGKITTSALTLSSTQNDAKRKEEIASRASKNADDL